MKGRDLAVTMATVYDKRSLLRGDSSSAGPEQTSQADKLKALETKFNQFANQLKNESITVERVKENER